MNGNINATSSGQISKDCLSHTGEEWLRILQDKSAAQGKKLSWWQIKQDPMINHQEIKDQLGAYANYENKLFSQVIQKEPIAPELIKPGVAKPEPKDKESTKVRSTPPPVESTQASKSKIIWLNDHDDPTKRKNVTSRAFEGGCLGRITVPLNQTWEHRGIIIISKIREDGIEEHIDLEELKFIQVDPGFSRQDLQRVFAGLGRDCYIYEAAISEERISTRIKWKDALLPDSIIDFRILPQQKVRLFFGLILFTDQYNCENYDYIICDVEGLDRKQKVAILKSKFYKTFAPKK